MNYLKDKNKRNAIIGTVLIHLILVLIFVFTGLKYIVPIPEQGILINFGTVDEGFGEIQPEEITSTETIEIPEKDVIEQNTQPQPSETVEEVITQNTEEAPALNTETSSNIESEIVEEEEPKPVIDPTALYTGKISNQETGNEGETVKSGDQGNIDGSPDSKNHSKLKGKGKGFYLSGRDIIFKPDIKENPQETGRVVVNIWVNRIGKVTRATAGAKGSTTTDAYLYKIAKEAAIKAKFSANPDAPEEQKGTIVFDFTVSE